MSNFWTASPHAAHRRGFFYRVTARGRPVIYDGITRELSMKLAFSIVFVLASLQAFANCGKYQSTKCDEYDANADRGLTADEIDQRGLACLYEFDERPAGKPSARDLQLEICGNFLRTKASQMKMNANWDRLDAKRAAEQAAYQASVQAAQDKYVRECKEYILKYPDGIPCPNVP